MAILSASILYYLIGLLGTLVLVLCLIFNWAHGYWARAGIPHVPPDFLLGSLHRSTMMRTTVGEELAQYYHQYKAKGARFFGVHLFHEPILVPTDPELIKNMMTKHFDHFVDRGTYCNEDSDPLSAHLFSLEGTKWKQLRQKLSPTFTSVKLKMMFRTLVDCTEELKNCLDGSVDRCEPIDIKQTVSKYAADVIGSCTFGLDCNSFKTQDSDFIKYGAKIFQPEPWDRFKVFFSFLFPGLAGVLKIRATNKNVDMFFRKLVKDTIEYRKKNDVSRKDFMQLLIQLKGSAQEEISSSRSRASLSMNEISAQAFLFFVAGFETSSITMTLCLYELSKQPQIQQRVREEIVKVLKKHEGNITYDAMMDMHYMERVIQETLRKHPPIMLLQRKVTQDYPVPESDVVLKKNTLVFIPVLGLHSDAEYYPEPDKFDPDRFTEENKQTRPDYSYIPFGGGPRICIGLRFGMIQMKVGLCRLLLNYKFSTNPKTKEPIELDQTSFTRSVKGCIWLSAERVAT